jgi:hypothetical protein
MWTTGRNSRLFPAVEGTGLADVIPARGAAFGDLFNDGKIDVVVNCMDHTPVLLQNVNADTNHWVGLALIGGPKSPRDAIGSTVYLSSGGIRQRGDVMSGGSYESSNDQRLHFGLGQTTKVDKVEIHWPDGKLETLTLPSVDRYFTIEEDKGIVPSVYDSIAAGRAKRKTPPPPRTRSCPKERHPLRILRRSARHWQDGRPRLSRQLQADRKEYNAEVTPSYNFHYGKEPLYSRKHSSAGRGILQPGAYPSAEYCGTCHQEAYSQWRQALHSNAFRTPFYRTSVNLLIRDQTRGIAFARHCDSCHNPIGVLGARLLKTRRSIAPSSTPTA